MSKEIQKRIEDELKRRSINIDLIYRTGQSKFKDDAPPNNFFPTYEEYQSFVETGVKGKACVFLETRKVGGPLVIDKILAYSFAEIETIMNMEHEKETDFNKYVENALIPIMKTHRIDNNRKFYVDLEKIRIGSKYRFDSEQELYEQIARVF